MTDDEIIKELQAVSEWFTEHGKNTNTSVIEISKRAIYLINRQKAEIERYLHSIKLLENDVATAKSEAIKEFAEKLKMECYATYDEVLPSLFADIIDKFVKEMTERDGK